ncbi:hypothetical protein ACFLU8_02325 [Chloroflexota bacterium]
MQYFTERETWSTDTHRQFFGIEPIIVDFTKFWEQEQIIKGLLVTNREETARAKDFCLQFEGSLHFS